MDITEEACLYLLITLVLKHIRGGSEVDVCLLRTPRAFPRNRSNRNNNPVNNSTPHHRHHQLLSNHKNNRMDINYRHF